MLSSIQRVEKTRPIYALNQLSCAPLLFGHVERIKEEKSVRI